MWQILTVALMSTYARFVTSVIDQIPNVNLPNFGCLLLLRVSI